MNTFYNNFFEQMAKAFYQGKGSVGTFKIMLMPSTYTPDPDNDAYYSDVSAEEITGGGYTAGGQAVDNLTITQNNTDNRADIDFDNEVFSGLTQADIAGFILYEDTGVDATSTLIGYFPFVEGTQAVVAGTLTVTPPAAGVHTVG